VSQQEPLSPASTAALQAVEDAVREFHLTMWREADEPVDTSVLQSLFVVSHWQEIDADTNRVVSIYPVITNEHQPPHVTEGLLLMAARTLEEDDDE
jgi:hypothetical protein